MMKNRCLATFLLCLTIHSGRGGIFDKDDLTSLNPNLASLTQNLDVGSLVEFGVKTLLPSLVSNVHKINKREADGSQTSMADKLGISILQEEFVREGQPTGNTIVINMDNLQKLYIIPGIHQAQLNISYFHGVNETASDLVVQTSFLVHTSKGPESGNILYKGYKLNEDALELDISDEDLPNSLDGTRWKYSVSASFGGRYFRNIMPRIVARTSASLIGNQLEVMVSDLLGQNFNLLVNGNHAPGISYNFVADWGAPLPNWRIFGLKYHYAGNFSLAMQERGMPLRYHITGNDLNLAGIIKTNLMEQTVAGSTKIAFDGQVLTAEIGGEFDFAGFSGEVNLKSDEKDFMGFKLSVQGQSQSEWTANFGVTYLNAHHANMAFGMDLLKSRYSLNASMADGIESRVPGNNTVNLVVDVLQGRYQAVVQSQLNYYGFDLKGAQLKPDNKGILTIYLGRNGARTADWDVKVALPDFNLNLVEKWNNQNNAFHLNINNKKLDWNRDPRTIEGNLVIDVGVGEDKVKLEVDRYAKNGTYHAIKFERWLSAQPAGPWITLESTESHKDLTFGAKIERIIDVLEFHLYPWHRSFPWGQMVNNLRFSVGNVDTTSITGKTKTLYAKFDLDAKENYIKYGRRYDDEFTYPYHIAVSAREDLSENVTLDLKLGRRVNVTATANVHGLTSKDVTFLGSVNNGRFHFEAHVGAGQDQWHPNVTFDMFDQAENHMLVEMINHPALVDSWSDVHYEISYSDDFEYFPSGKASLVTDSDDTSLVIHNKPEIGEEWDLYIAKNRANLTFRFMRDESITTSMFGTESWSYLANWDNKTTTLELGLADKSLLYPLICRFYCFKEYKEETWYERFRAFPKYIFAYRYEGKMDNRPMVLNYNSMANTIILELGEDFKLELDKEVLAPIFVQLDIDPAYWNPYL